MNELKQYLEQLKERVNLLLEQLRARVFGANNERLDFLMDSFYKLEPKERIGVLAGIAGAIGFVIIVAFAIYFSQVNRLKAELNDSFAALHELQELKADYSIEDARFQRVVEQVQKKTGDLQVKPFFEKVARDTLVQLEGLNVQRNPLDADNPLGSKMQEVKVKDLRINNTSIPKVLNFLIEIEKANNYIRVQDLEIRGRFGTRLYFDTKLTARGYAVGG
jgi:chaperonin cofactor prefoldin